MIPRRIAAVLVCLSLILPLGGCAGSSVPLTVDGSEISREEYIYYLDREEAAHPEASESELLTYAAQDCERYCAVQKLSQDMGVSLTQAGKAEASDRANALWQFFGKYYEAAGVSKQTYVSVFINEALRDAVGKADFDTGGRAAIAEDLIKTQFYNSYAVCRYVSRKLTDTDMYGTETAMTADEKAAAVAEYTAAAAKINAGQDVGAVFASLSGSGRDYRASLNNVFVDKTDSGLPDGFFAAVSACAVNSAVMTELDPYIYVIFRTDALADGTTFYSQHRAECLKALYDKPLTQLLDNTQQVIRSDKSAQAACLKTLTKVKEKFNADS